MIFLPFTNFMLIPPLSRKESSVAIPPLPTPFFFPSRLYGNLLALLFQLSPTLSAFPFTALFRRSTSPPLPVARLTAHRFVFPSPVDFPSPFFLISPPHASHCYRLVPPFSPLVSTSFFVWFFFLCPPFFFFYHTELPIHVSVMKAFASSLPIRQHQPTFPLQCDRRTCRLWRSFGSIVGHGAFLCPSPPGKSAVIHHDPMGV